MSSLDLLIINRRFWPEYPVIGESLLKLAESYSGSQKVGVVCQRYKFFKKELKEKNRGYKVHFYTSPALTNSSSKIYLRLIDTIYFALWTLGVIFFSKPRKIYISTDPPIFVPFLVSLYCKFANSKFIYHVQDIHPEASGLVLNINKFFFRLLQRIDTYTISNADYILTLSNRMLNTLTKRVKGKIRIGILENPSVEFDEFRLTNTKKKGFVFVGNAGRFQRIPFLLSAIKKYHSLGGKLEFNFAGGGIYSKEILQFSENNSLINYHGVISPEDSAYLAGSYEWALLPIDDRVLDYAFPSKASTYIKVGSKILSISKENSYISEWVEKKNLGINCSPDIAKLVATFKSIENDFCKFDRGIDASSLEEFSNEFFVSSLKRTLDNLE